MTHPFVIDQQRQLKPEPLEIELLREPIEPNDAFGLPRAETRERSLQDFYLAGGWVPTVPGELA
jgi:hypothetical protein